MEQKVDVISFVAKCSKKRNSRVKHQSNVFVTLNASMHGIGELTLKIGLDKSSFAFLLLDRTQGQTWIIICCSVN